MKKLLFYIKTLILLGFLQGCSLDFPPEDQISDPDAITSVLAAQRVLASAYYSYNEYSYFFENVVLSDDLQPTSLLSRNVSLQKTYNWSEENLILLAENIWTKNYHTIAQINVLLERLPNISTSNSSDLAEINQIKTQALYLKGLCYFELLKYFSPSFKASESENYGILLKNNFVKTENQQRSSLSESVKEIDFLLSQPLSSSSDKALITADAAQYLRAELALWEGNYNKCLEIAVPLYNKYQQVIEANLPSSLWKNSDSPLRLFYLDTKNKSTNLYTDLLYDENIGEYLAVNSTISYENSDTRAGIYSVASDIQRDSNGDALFLIGKYNLQQKTEKSTNYYTVIRASGLVFLCAEAYLKTNQKSKAVEIVNNFLQIRKQSTSLLESTDNETLLIQILSEKQKEFVGESQRFFDLKRNLLPIERISFGGNSVKIDENDFRWTLPIPTSEVRQNTIILQNKNWENFIKSK
ncbi:MAG: RagB/SusD family nutrient uptake outer membrane protein [Capnocytophaga sp.]|nr:RagB/SusD family nutrient uptake outer membrane protein [Capnocytophaga sp.]